MAELHDSPDHKVFRAAFTKSDTDGEVIFATANTLTYGDFQWPTKHKPRIFPTSPSVSKAPKSPDHSAKSSNETLLMHVEHSLERRSSVGARRADLDRL